MIAWQDSTRRENLFKDDPRFFRNKDEGKVKKRAAKNASDGHMYKSFTVYLLSIFKSSLITSFPEIAASKSWIKRLIKIIVFIICTIGFIYQTWDFLSLYYSYPTVVNIQVSNPFQITQPAITVCNKNRIRRSAICSIAECAMYEEEMFREMYKVYCPDIGKCFTGMPFVNLYVPGQSEWGEAFNMSHKASIIDSCYKIVEGVHIKCELPYREVPIVTSEGDPNICYTIESQWGKPDSKPDVYPNTFAFVIEFNTQPDEYMVATEPVIIQIAVHERKRLVSPYADGYPLRGGRVYEAYVSMNEKEMLPYPYDTNCTNYNELWKKNNGTGPLNELMCIEQCKLKTLLKRNKCIDKNVAYPHLDTLCKKGVVTTTSDIIESCTLACNPSCTDQTYEVRYEEINNYGHLCNSEWCKLSKVKLTVFFKRFRVQKFLYQPKFASIEMFSYIGGYMGMWLGLSLVSLFDFFETITYLIYFPIGRFRARRRQDASKQQWTSKGKSTDPSY